MITKICSVCSLNKSSEDFYKHKKSKDGLQSYCKVCSNKKIQEYKEKNPDKIQKIKAKHMRKRRYGIEEEAYQQLLQNQNGKCAICNLACVSGRNLAVDHNHQSGVVRGLLCSNCNTSLGGFQDNKELLYKAIKYLETYEN